MARVVWTAPALKHLQEIVAFLANHSIARADEINTKILAAADRLEYLPLMGRVVPEFKREDFREIIESRYRLMYLVHDDVCSIIAVIHGSRDVGRLIHPEDLDLTDDSAETE
jgi:toxin ParE1/3/4